MTNEQQYICGFNQGYLMTKHLPDLTAKLIKRIDRNAGDYSAGFFSGKEEYELEATRTQLNELRNIRNSSNEREHDLDRDR
jgi:hypothetical protein